MSITKSPSELTANVVDIRRFSTHDGDGIRTTIFIKGCSLACHWCQNPEAIDARRGPVFLRKRCIDCGLCVAAADRGEAYLDAEGHVQVDTTIADADWPHLVKVCPTGAISFDSTRYSVQQLVKLAQRDRPFFGSTGGVTLSGGEPLFLPHFAAATLQALQAAGINTAIETALNVRTEFLMDAVQHTDHVFADCKLIDSDAHKQYTGQPNGQILANLRALLLGDRRADVTVRTPMIPGITDTESNITGIVEFITALYPEVRYELLNYNPLASAKYDALPGREYIFDRDNGPKMHSPAQMDVFRDWARSAGIKNIELD